MTTFKRILRTLNKEQRKVVSEDVFSSLRSSVNSPSLRTKPRQFNFNAYRDENENPFMFRAVEKAQQEIVDLNMDKEYSSMEGISTFNEVVQKTFFGEEHPLVQDHKILTMQTLSGTGALRVGLEFLRQHAPAEVFISDPIEENCIEIVKKSGLSYTTYPYFDSMSMKLNFNGMRKALSAAKPGSIVLLQASGHKPTGVDPTPEQWRILAKLFKRKRLLPFFECASQGLISGDLESDIRSIHIFLEEGLQLLVAQSFSRNMGMYGDRVGALHVVCTSSNVATIVHSNLSVTIRGMYGMPPINGARVVEKVLKNPEYKAQWLEDLKIISDRIKKMRNLLYDELMAVGPAGNWQHITKQVGLFWYTGFTTKECEDLVHKHNLYFLENGTVNMACVNHRNVKFIAQAINDVTKVTNEEEEITIMVPQV